MSKSVKPNKESLELVVLGVLGEEPLYGYAIIKRVTARSDEAIKLTAGGLYPLLHELEAARLISSTWETVKSERAGEESAGRKRKWYRITDKGRKRLEQRISAHRAFAQMLESFFHPPMGENARST